MWFRSRASLFLAAAVALVSLVAASRPAAATLIIVPNASFEDPNVADGDFTSSSGFDAVPNWTFAQTFNGTITAGVWDPINAEYSGTTGDNAPLPGTASGGQAAYIYLQQTDDLMLEALTGELSTETALVTVQPNTVYTLTVAVGHAQTFLPGDVTIGLYRDDNQTALAETVIPSAAIPANTFADFSAVFTSLPVNDPANGTGVIIRIGHTHLDAGERSVDFDNIRLDVTPVPEPASVATLALALIGALTTRRPRGRR